MSRYLNDEQHAEIRKLRIDQGMMIRDIAKRFNCSHATVSNICKGTTVPRGSDKIRKRPEFNKMPDAKEVEFVDFSKLPKHILFEHVRESNFIG